HGWDWNHLDGFHFSQGLAPGILSFSDLDFSGGFYGHGRIRFLRIGLRVFRTLDCTTVFSGLLDPGFRILDLHYSFSDLLDFPVS
ncbi:MAG TPA: hypothetical protein VI233_14830, partial [Puia sp.]